MHLLLASLLESTTARWLIGILVVGLLGSFLIGFWPQLRAFVDSLPKRLRNLRHEAVAVTRDPRRAADAVEAIARLPRAAVAYGLIGVALAAWAVYAFTQPATESRAAELQHVSSIGYVARGAPSVTMPDGAAAPVSAETVARTGEPPPLFSAVLSKIDFGYTYELRAPKPVNVIGVGGSALRIKAEDGWERTIVLQPSQPVSGQNVTLWFTVDLDMVRLVIVGVERETGSKSGWYDLTVVPVVRLVGEAGGAQIDETYSREFNLRYDPVRITPDPQLERSERTLASGKVRVVRQARAFGLAMDWSAARWVAGLGALVALGAAVALAATEGGAGAHTLVSHATVDSLPANVVPHRPAAVRATSVAAQAPPAAFAPENGTSGAVKESEAMHSAVDAEAEALLAASVAPSANGAAAPEGSPPLERVG